MVTIRLRLEYEGTDFSGWATQKTPDDIRTVQDLLGHQDVKTTMVYMNLSNLKTLKVKSPLDNL